MRLSLRPRLLWAGLIPKLRPLYCRVPKHGFSRTPWHTYAHPPVSVYGTVSISLALEGFLDTAVPILVRLAADSRSRRGLCSADLHAEHPCAPEVSFQETRPVERCVTPSKKYGSAGILTCCPSTTPFGLALGPTNPGTIRVALETLGLWWKGFSPFLMLLMPTFSLLSAPRWLTPSASARRECSLTAPSDVNAGRNPRLRYHT